MKKTFILTSSALLLCLAFSQNSKADSNIEFSRVSGKNRYETAVAISKESFKHTDSVVLANGEDFADALSGGQLASALDSPILLTNKNTISATTLKEIDRLSPRKIYILGGDNSVSKTVENGLSSKYSVDRLGGENRFETSKLIRNKSISLGKSRDTIIVNGRNFADALSAGSIVANTDYTMILSEKNVNPTINADNVLLVGGKGSLNYDYPHSNRIEGLTRYETSSNIANKFFAKSENAIIVSGEDFPDALTAVSLSKKHKAPLILSKRYGANDTSVDYIKKHTNNAIIVGGESSVSDIVVTKIYTSLYTPKDPNEKIKIKEKTIKSESLVTEEKNINLNNGQQATPKGMVKITFDQGYDGAPAPEVQFVKKGARANVPREVRRYGHYFDDWANNGKIINFEKDTFTTDTTLKPVWKSIRQNKPLQSDDVQVTIDMGTEHVKPQDRYVKFYLPKNASYFDTHRYGFDTSKIIDRYYISGFECNGKKIDEYTYAFKNNTLLKPIWSKKIKITVDRGSLFLDKRFSDIYCNNTDDIERHPLYYIYDLIERTDFNNPYIMDKFFVKGKEIDICKYRPSDGDTISIQWKKRMEDMVYIRLVSKDKKLLKFDNIDKGGYYEPYIPNFEKTKYSFDEDFSTTIDFHGLRLDKDTTIYCDAVKMVRVSVMLREENNSFHSAHYIYVEKGKKLPKNDFERILNHYGKPYLDESFTKEINLNTYTFNEDTRIYIKPKKQVSVNLLEPNFKDTGFSKVNTLTLLEGSKANRIGYNSDSLNYYNEKFLGYYIDKDYKNKVDLDTYEFNKDTDLYLKWKSDKDIYIDFNYENLPKKKINIRKNQNPTKIDIPDRSKESYVFVGISDNPTIDKLSPSDYKDRKNDYYINQTYRGYNELKDGQTLYVNWLKKSGDYLYDPTNNTLMTYIGIGNSSSTIPNQLDATKINHIAPQAFYNSYWNNSLIIPEGITSIGDGAFEYSRLKGSVQLPKSLKTIGVYPFISNKDITKFKIYSGNTYPGPWANITSGYGYFSPEIETYD